MLLIFTDLDGTLLNQEDYSYQAAIPLIEQLKKQQIPLIPVTSKTRQEVETLRQLLNLIDSFIVENGSGVFIPQQQQELAGDAQLWEEYYLLSLGCDYEAARVGLRALEQSLGESLQGFGDLSATEVQQLTGLNLEQVQQAQYREFTEPFVTPQKAKPEAIEMVVQKLGFEVVVGDRFCHLIGSGAGKGKAVQWLVQQYQNLHPQTKITTVGLGNSPNDLGMLEVVDLPIIIPGKSGVHPGLKGRDWQVAPQVAPQGWVSALTAVLG